MNIPKKHCQHNSLSVADVDILAHCHGMLDEMELLLTMPENKMEKVFRWLGFIQGCLWSLHLYTIEEMKNNNRP